ncbi:transporter [Alcanivorax sp. S6407]|uniref:transporter n=1 Tax=Alcanivorax sp. S6407 TaxID=2926424 RepID=UPI001FF1B0FE|nr:transporter [Alcanivorax sp. S6407]MCK0152232.1 transporter [Alcanivorax sp. S6407]
MSLRFLPVALAVSSACLPALSAAHYDGGRADSHAPISVTGDHTHGAKEWMLAYRYMGMRMSGARSGTDSLSTEEAFAEIPGAMGMKVLPYEMQMEMHMIGGMYAPTDNLTLVAMLPYATKEMTAKTRMTMMGNTMEGETEAETSGIGDAGIGGLYKVLDEDGYRLHFNLVLGLPTGSIEEEDYIPMQQQDAQLPYGMQLGSGSYELRPGVTLNKQYASWSWGAQLSGRVALDENDQGYKLGSRKNLTAWAAKPVAPWASVSVAAYQSWWSDIHGSAEDLTINPLVNPAADPESKGGRRLDLGVGVNLLGKQGAVKGHRLAFEYKAPVQQSLNGLQLENDYVFVVGWQKAFGG